MSNNEKINSMYHFHQVKKEFFPVEIQNLAPSKEKNIKLELRYGFI